MNRHQLISRYLLQAAPPKRHPSWPVEKEASVLIPLLDDGGPLRLLLTRRSQRLRNHAGQLSFPGGRRDPDDRDLRHTALRECQEEIGLRPDKVEILGQQPSMTTISGFRVTPFVGLVPADHPLTPDHQEVAEILDVPLSHLLVEDHWISRTIKRGGRKHQVWFIAHQEQLIWGVTAGILHQFISQITCSTTFTEPEVPHDQRV